MAEEIIKNLMELFEDMINNIPENKLKAEWAETINKIKYDIQAIEDDNNINVEPEQGGMSVGGSKYLTEGEKLDVKKTYICELCHGKYTGAHRSAHIKSKKHRIAEAKDYGQFDFNDYKILTKQTNKKLSDS
jgi:hypothetical protein